MENLQELFRSINELKSEYDKEREKNRFSVFTALYRKYDEEENLHSRFISYLLSPTSGHGMDNLFLKIFVRQVLKLNENEFDIDLCEVIPNENNKSEYKFIDILIINKAKKQAIIIENKINAGDSNRTGEKKKDDGYDGQLERYHKTIKTGIDKNYQKGFDFQCNDVFVYYLSMYNHRQPSKESIRALQGCSDWRGAIFYSDEIREWLQMCIDQLSLEKLLIKEFIKQYLNLINIMTHNDIFIEERKKLKNEVAKNVESVRYLTDNFKHVKWHTVDDFWMALENELKKYYKNVDTYSDGDPEFIKTVGRVAHRNEKINYGLLFDSKIGKKIYISGLSDLSWGIIDSKQWMDFNSEILKQINFSNFDTKNTFRLIDENNMKEAVKLIVKEIMEKEEEYFEGMRSI